MMNGCMMFGMPMMFGMVLVALLLIATLVLVAGAALKYIRSGSRAQDRPPSFGREGGGR